MRKIKIFSIKFHFYFIQKKSFHIIRLKKENQLYDYVKEPEPILLEDEEKNDILVSSAVQLFGDIVEID